MVKKMARRKEIYRKLLAAYFEKIKDKIDGIRKVEAKYIIARDLGCSLRHATNILNNFLALKLIEIKRESIKRGGKITSIEIVRAAPTKDLSWLKRKK